MDQTQYGYSRCKTYTVDSNGKQLVSLKHLLKYTGYGSYQFLLINLVSTRYPLSKNYIIYFEHLWSKFHALYFVRHTNTETDIRQTVCFTTLEDIS